MFKQHLVKLIVSLTILGSLLSGGAALSTSMTAKAAPAAPRLACVQIILPPCI